MQIRVHVGEFFIHLLDGDGNSIVVTLATDKKNLMAGVVVSSWRGGGAANSSEIDRRGCGWVVIGDKRESLKYPSLVFKLHSEMVNTRMET